MHAGMVVRAILLKYIRFLIEILSSNCDKYVSHVMKGGLNFF